MQTTEQRVSFGRLLQRYRSAAGLTQEALAELAGLSRRGIADLERGARQSPHLATVRRLAEALSLTDIARADLMSAARAQSDNAAPQELGRVSDLGEPLTSFIGRERDVRDVCERLECVRNLQERLEQRQLLHELECGRVNRVATKFAVEVAMRLQERDSDTAPSEQQR